MHEWPNNEWVCRRVCWRSCTVFFLITGLRLAPPARPGLALCKASSYPLGLCSRPNFIVIPALVAENINSMELGSICTMIKRYFDRRRAWLGTRVQSEEGNQVERIIRNVTRLHAAISQEPDLRPSSRVNGLFKELVSLCTQTLSQSRVSKASHFSQIRNNH
jgi:hypothetical protein